MFQIPDEDDEDDEFWKEFPLEDFENIPVNKGEKKRHGSPSHKSEEELKKPCMINIENASDSNQCNSNSALGSKNLTRISNNNFSPKGESFSIAKRFSQQNSQRSGIVDNSSCFVSATEPQQMQLIPDVNHSYSTKQRQTPQSKRKFPGPAGMLPRLVPGQKLTDNIIKLDGRVGDTQLQKNNNLLSANPVDDFFAESPWLKLISDLGEDSSRILRMFSIKELHQKACKKQLHNGKVLLLFTVLETVDLSNIDACVRLRDTTGSIQGTLHRNLVKEYGEHLQPGTVLVLKQVGVLSPTPWNHYLNITANNLVSLYSILPSGQVGIYWQEQGITYKKLLKSAENLEKSLTIISPVSLPTTNMGIPIQSSPKNQLVKNTPVLNRHLSSVESLVLPPNRPSQIRTTSVSNSPIVTRPTSSIEKNHLQNGTKNSFLDHQTKVCDKISCLPPHNKDRFATPDLNLTTPQSQHSGDNLQTNSSFLNNPSSKSSLSQSGRSRWTFKSICKPISEPSSPLSISNTIKSVGDQNHVAFPSDHSNNVDNVFMPKNDKYRLREDNDINTNQILKSSTNTTCEATSNPTDIWQDELPDDILSQLSEDLF